VVTCEFRWRTDGTTMSSARGRRYLRALAHLWTRYLPWRLLPPAYGNDGAGPLRAPWPDLLFDGMPRAVLARARRIRERLLSTWGKE
jgi:hypothetical protein